MKPFNLSGGVCLLLTSLIIVSCGGGVRTSSELKASGALQKLDRSSDLAGPDVDGNGVRDDIDDTLRAYPQHSGLEAAKTDSKRCSRPV